jgi:CRISPR-associated protein Cst1
MIEELENGRVRIEPSDWRWGASIVGLSKYFDYHNINYKVDDEYIEFDESTVDKEKYLHFVEYYFSNRMHHKIIEELLELDTLSDEQIKLVNEKLAGNSIMKKVMGKIKYHSNNKNEILQLISESRSEIVKNTFREGKALYANFCNKGNLFEDKGSTCRLIGYYVDKGRKMQALSFGTDKNTFVYQDSKYFDFIPFGFSKTRESFFVNNNFTVKQLINSNKTDLLIDENVKVSNLLYRVKDAAVYIDYDVEVIKKDRDLDHYETVFVRKKAIEIFKQLDSDTLEILKKACNGKKSDKAQDNWINAEKIVTNSILNNIKLDNLIENLFKAYNNHKFLLLHLIKINQLIYGEENKMKANHRKAYEAALEVQKVLVTKKNKIRSYEQRLISAISLKDNDKVKEILLHLSAYTQVRMDFLIDVFEDFEGSKNLVYTFINTLGEKNQLEKASDKGASK